MQTVYAGFHSLLIALGALIIGVLIGAAFNRVLLRLPRLIAARLKALPRALKIFGRRSGAGGLSAHPESAGALTAIQRELSRPDSDAKGEAKRGAAKSGAAFDIRRAEADLVQRVGFAYRKFRKPAAEYDNLPDTFPPELADAYAELARQFLSAPVALTTDHNNLYEDEEGAVIVRMFRRSDRPIFYAIDRFRRVIGDNARTVITHFFLAAIFPMACAAILAAFNLQKNAAGFSVAATLSVLGGIGAVLSYFSYTNARNSGFSDFSGLLERYMAGVSDKFFHANTRMSQVILGEEDDHERLAANAEKWHKIMLWLGFRAFFIESFLRGAVYQARRNLGYYQLAGGIALVAIPIIIAAAGVSAAYGHLNGAPADIGALLRERPETLLYAFGVFAGLLSFYFVQRKDADHTLSAQDWRGFKALHMDEKFGDAIGKYAQEAAIGKRRGVVRPGGGGH